jgi:hypothetical protein
MENPTLQDLQYSGDGASGNGLKFGLVHVKWKEDEDCVLGPFPYRCFNNYVVFPPFGEGTYHIVEVVAAIRKGYHVKMIEAWIMSPPYSYPFADKVASMAAERLKLKKLKDAANKPLKLGLNGFYGKFATRPTDGMPSPPFRELLWAGYLTAQGRANMLKPTDPESMILFATDGIYSEKILHCPSCLCEGIKEKGPTKHDPATRCQICHMPEHCTVCNNELITIGEHLGEFEYEYHEKAIFLLAGIYCVTVECDKKDCEKLGCDGRLHWQNKERGYTNLNVHDTYLKYFAEDNRNKDDEDSECSVEDDRFIGIKLGLATPAANRFCEWRTIMRVIDWDNNHKRAFSGNHHSKPSTAGVSEDVPSWPYKEEVKVTEDEENIGEFPDF